MQISCFQSCSNRSQGFTLIEILVVLFIVTILAGLVVARLPAFGSDADFEFEADRLQLLLRMARNEAVLETIEYGFRQTDAGYEFLQFDDAGQQWVKAAAPFHARRIDDDIRLTVRSGGGSYDVLGNDLPPVLLLSSGETTPFRLILESASSGERRVLGTDGYSEITWLKDAD